MYGFHWSFWAWKCTINRPVAISPLPDSFGRLNLVEIIWTWKSGDSLQKSIPIEVWQGCSIVNDSGETAQILIVHS
jgi:hypothetical protein